MATLTASRTLPGTSTVVDAVWEADSPHIYLFIGESNVDSIGVFDHATEKLTIAFDQASLEQEMDQWLESSKESHQVFIDLAARGDNKTRNL